MLRKPVLILITILYITSCCAGDKKNKTKKKNRDKESPFRYITNWSEYDMPPNTEVHVDILKDILTKLSLYARGNYCPFDDENCNRELRDVVKKILDIFIKTESTSTNNATNNATDKNDTTNTAPLTEKGKSNENKPALRTLHGPVGADEIVPKHIRNKMQKLLMLARKKTDQKNIVTKLNHAKFTNLFNRFGSRDYGMLPHNFPEKNNIIFASYKHP